MTSEEIEALDSEEALVYLLWRDGVSSEKIALALEIDEPSVKRKISKAILRIELRRKLNEQNRRISWP